MKNIGFHIKVDAYVIIMQIIEMKQFCAYLSNQFSHKKKINYTH